MHKQRNDASKMQLITQALFSDNRGVNELHLSV